MVKTITVIKKGEGDMFELFQNGIKTDILFCEIQKDTVGRSGSCPTWGEVYSNENGTIKFKGIALYKEYDYDFPYAAYGEKVWSIFGKELIGNTVRVPNVNMVTPKNR